MSQALPPKSPISKDFAKEALEGDRSVKAASIPSLMGESFKDSLREMKDGIKDDGSIGMSSTAKEKPPLMSKDDSQIGMSGFVQERQEVMKDFQDAFKKNNLSSAERSVGKSAGNIHKARLGGFTVTIKSFDQKLKELAKRRLSANEDSDSGSEDENDTMEDIDAQVTALKAQKEVIEVEKALAQLIAEEEKDTDEIEAKREQQRQEEAELFFEKEEKAREFAGKVAYQYKALGIDCEIVKDGNSFSVESKEQTKEVVKDSLQQRPSLSERILKERKHHDVGGHGLGF